MTAKCRLPIKDIQEYFNPNTTIKRKKELVLDIHITGGHYAYLNYGRIERVPDDIERAEEHVCHVCRKRRCSGHHDRRN